MIRIHAAGGRATIQDAGRFGHLREGLPPSGPADPGAFAAAQWLVRNDPSAAAIEIVGSPFVFSCDDRRLVAVTGRDVALRSRDRLPGWTAVFARAGEEITVIGSERSRFTYLAVSGGIAAEPVLGSRATYLPAGLGHLVRSGDTWPLGTAHIDPAAAGRTAKQPEYQDEFVRAITGPHTERFTDEEAEGFFSSQFTVDAMSDRMATRLAGKLVRSRGGELLTCGVIAGAVQVPPGGQPIVLLSEHQVTGGYPVIATVITADLGRVAQRLPGEPLRFARVARELATAALRGERAALPDNA
jgi:biotin-dependent carboxylase-like uncharacterized protein